LKDQAMAGFLRDHPDGCSLAVRVQPGARQNAITGIYGAAAECQLKIALRASPIDGRANEALIAFLAEFFGLARSTVSIAHGQTSRSKLVILRSVKAADAQARIGAAITVSIS
jgi:uncharacterized protein (TIGR00251 family)